MKQWWTIQSARIDAMTLRERVILFVSFILIAMALAHVLWLEPTQIAHKQAVQRNAAQGVELVRLRAELTAVAQPVDANKAARDELAAAESQLAEVMQSIKTLAPVGEGGPDLEKVLVQFLKAHPGLTLLGTSTMDRAASPPAGATPAKGAEGNLMPGLIRRGLELRVAGSYGDLTRYVKSLEGALPNLRWGPLHLSSDKVNPELTLQVYVVGVQP